MKRWAALLLTVILCVCMAGCTVWERKHFAENLINQYSKEVNTMAANALSTGSAPEDSGIPGVEKVSVFQPDWVDFCTGSRGEGDEAAYCGFYFSSKDVALGYQGTDLELTPDGSGFAWHSAEDKDNRYYTESIMMNWFYYERYF